MTRRWRDGLILLLLGLMVRLVSAALIQQPGYTDAYYYAVGARQLFAGQGFTQSLIWNYLSPPAGIPHPGYQYWMPLPAILGWLGMLLLGPSYQAMQTPFVVLSALLPVVAYAIAWDLCHKRRHALLAGAIGLFPGFYAHGLVLPETFAPFALAGSLSLWFSGRGWRDGNAYWFGLAGLAGGLAHLARADGLLLSGVVLCSALGRDLCSRRGNRSVSIKQTLVHLIVATASYLLIMAPWLIRNSQVLGTLLPPTGTSTLFLTNYDDIFAYNRPLTLESYLAWGWGSILASKWQALVINVQRIWAEGLLIFLLPFSALGLWALRGKKVLWPFLLYAPLLFLAMTLAFTFPGMRGGLYHSAGALQPFFFAAAGPGLETLLLWAARRRRSWHVPSAWKVFAGGLVVLALLVTLVAQWRLGILTGDWNQRDIEYREIGAWLDTAGAADAIVMTGGAASFAWHTGHPAIAVPNEPLDTILTVADRYGAQYLLLDKARPRTTDEIYSGRVSDARLDLRHTVGPDDAPYLLYEIGTR